MRRGETEESSATQKHGRSNLFSVPPPKGQHGALHRVAAALEPGPKTPKRTIKVLPKVKFMSIRFYIYLGYLRV